VEIFIDDDPGFGKGKTFSGNVGNNSYVLSSSSLSTGTHFISARTQNSNGQWSATVTNPLYVTKIFSKNASLIEYFIDDDPGVSNGIQVKAAGDETTIAISTSSIKSGAHLISVRTCDEHGNWSATVTIPLYVVEPIEIDMAEYYVDNDPGEGKGTPVFIQAGANTSFTVSTNNLSVGEHQLVLRGRLYNGMYVTLFEAPFAVTDLNGITGTEWSMDINIKCVDGEIYVSGESLVESCTIDVFDPNGIKIASESKKSGTTEHIININKRHGPYIVSITSGDGRKYVKMVK